jgi:Zn-dependent protease
LQHFQDFLLIMPVLLLSVIAHEYAHGYAALKQGDDTALMLGRLTWNPIKHIDPFMTVLLPLMLWLAHGPLLGGAKPVPVNPRNYRNFKRGDIIVSLAGVFVNLLLAIASVILFVLVGLVLTVLGPILALFLWWMKRSKTPKEERGGLLSVALLRGALATFAGVVMWWIALVVLNYFKTGRFF